MFGFDQEICRPNTKELTKDRHIFKGNVLSKRRSIEQLVKEDLGRLVLPDIHSSRSGDTNCSKYEQIKTKGFIRRGYTFDLNKLRAEKSYESFDEDEMEKLLSLKSLDSFNKDDTQEESLYAEKSCSRRSSQQNGNKSKREDSRADSGFSDESLANSIASREEDTDNTYKAKRNQRFVGNVKYNQENTHASIASGRRGCFQEVKSCHVEVPSRLVIRKSDRVDIGATMCTQSFNSLCTDLSMFKDEVSRGLVREYGTQRTKTPRLLNIVPESKKSSPELDDTIRYKLKESGTRSNPARSDSVTSSCVNTTFAVFKERRRDLLSRSQRSRNRSKFCSESPLTRSGTELKDSCGSLPSARPCTAETNTEGLSCLKRGVASEATDGCYMCVAQSRVHFSLKNNVKSGPNSTSSKSRTVAIDDGSTNYYDCYTPASSKVVQFGLGSNKNVGVPLKLDSKVSAMPDVLLEFKKCKPKALQRRQPLKTGGQNVQSDPEISHREEKTLLITASYDLPPDMKLSDDEDDNDDAGPSLSGNGEAVWDVNSKCNEWLCRWIEGNSCNSVKKH
jgi:hypothetical protein